MSAAPAKVLVIDDERAIRKLLRTGLSTQGYEILEAPDGETALELLAQDPDMIILDLGLPGVKGLELLKTIRSRSESVPIVVLSSRSDEAGKVEALDLGADDYVTKPFGMDELLARLSRWRSHGRFGASHRQGSRQRGETVAEGIRPAARARPARGQGLDESIPAG
jgi:two-component system KDP operon response regulator KdpE